MKPTWLVVLVAIAAGCEKRAAPAAAADPLAALPAATDAVVRVSLADLRGTDAWPVIEGLIAAQRPLLDTIERVCGLRLLDLVDTVTVAGDGVHPGLSLAIVEGRFTAQQAEQCFAKVMSEDREAVVQARVADGITELSATGFAEKIHVRWLAPGAVLIPFDAPTDRARFDQALAGPRLAAGPIAAELGATAGAAIRVAAVGDEQRGPARLMEPLAQLTGPVPPLRARGEVEIDPGLTLELRLGFASPEQAGAAADSARQAIAGFAGAPTAGAFAALAGATSIEVTGSDVVLRASLVHDELAALADELAAGFVVP